jgi:hypothetical protein
MKIIEQLHIEACEDKENSHLAIWIKTIDGLVENLDRNKVSSPHLE